MESTDTALSALAPAALPQGRGQRALRLFLEGALHGGAALALSAWTGVGQSGFFALFLMAAGLARRFDQLLDENRRGIYEARLASARVNLRTAASLLAIFAGVLASFIAAAAWSGEAGLARSFGFVLEAEGLGRDTLATRHFGSAAGLLSHNGLVLLTFVVLALVYRGYGALLALCWNASVWGVVLTVLVRRGLPRGLGPALLSLLRTLAGLLPHLSLEVLGYLLGALAGIFLSKALQRYSLDDPRIGEVARACAVILLCAALSLTLAALAESTWAPWVLGA